MTTMSQVDQAWAKHKDEFEHLLTEIRTSRVRKIERHGDKFDANLAISDQVHNLTNAPHHVLAMIAAIALDRLAQMPDFDPLPVALTELDFEVDLEAPEGGEPDVEA